MSGDNIVADTSVLINFFNGHEFAKEFLEGRNIWLSGISEIEVLSFPGLSVNDKKLIRSFFNECKIIDLTPEIKEVAIEIRSRHKTKLPDAVIAATAIHLDFPLFTMDKGFKKITELQSVIIQF